MSVFTAAASTGVCVFCKRDDDDIAKYGGIKCTKNIKAHYFCLLLSTNIKQSGRDNSGILGFLHTDIREELERTENINCCYCKKPNATVYCSGIRCRKVFHLPCGMENHSSHSFLYNFKSFCHYHRHVQKIANPLKRSLTELSCLICCEQFKRDDFNDIFWPSCCQPQGLLHRICVQRYTMSAGYYTKCPTCNNAGKFISCCKEFGVFVPEQDASWEREPDAYAELYDTIVYDCSFEICICPQGRKFNNPHTRWRIINCCSCGAFGAHFACVNTSTFTCKDCKAVCKKFGYSETPRSDSESHSSDEGSQLFENSSYEEFVIGLRRANPVNDLNRLPLPQNVSSDLPTTSQDKDEDDENRGACANINVDNPGACSRTSSAESVVVDFNGLAIERVLASTDSKETVKLTAEKCTSTNCDEKGEDTSLNEASAWASVEENNNASRTTNEESANNGSSRKREVDNADPPSKKIHKSNC
ncbi:PHD finger protein 7-like isoform X2 [Agrilus planipennis]|uniref:PHD finger protein 7-like isoform X2 n=1 Tax=Agrilus planipennis TaxID=224129 RepID=A0A1W4X0A9_AGRPL|nr:PHD finger protein 7-like isoform X2 [Agrilus planipennis]